MSSVETCSERRSSRFADMEMPTSMAGGGRLAHVRNSLYKYSWAMDNDEGGEAEGVVEVEEVMTMFNKLSSLINRFISSSISNTATIISGVLGPNGMRQD